MFARRNGTFSSTDFVIDWKRQYSRGHQLQLALQ